MDNLKQILSPCVGGAFETIHENLDPSDFISQDAVETFRKEQRYEHEQLQKRKEQEQQEAHTSKSLRSSFLEQTQQDLVDAAMIATTSYDGDDDDDDEASFIAAETTAMQHTKSPAYFTNTVGQAKEQQLAQEARQDDGGSKSHQSRDSVTTIDVTNMDEILERPRRNEHNAARTTNHATLSSTLRGTAGPPNYDGLWRQVHEMTSEMEQVRNHVERLRTENAIILDNLHMAGQRAREAHAFLNAE